MGNVEFRSDGLSIAGQLTLPESARVAPPYPAVVICHGIGNRKEDSAPLARCLAGHGFAVLAVDFRGHGESDGRLDDGVLDDVIAALDFVSARPEVDPARVAVRGSSMGGMLALHAAACDGRVRALAVIAPAAEARAAEGVESGSLQRLLEREHLSVRIDAPSYVRFLRSHDVRRAVSALTGCALLLIHCKGDALIPHAHSEDLYAHASEPKKLILIENGHHRFAQQDSSVHQQTAEWFQKHLEKE